MDWLERKNKERARLSKQSYPHLNVRLDSSSFPQVEA